MSKYTCVLLLVASCVDEGDQRQTVEANDLGVVAIETTRSSTDGVTVYELRALDADQHEVGSVRLRVGVMPELDLPGDSDLGSELTFVIGGEERRTISRETQLFMLPT